MEKISKTNCGYLENLRDVLIEEINNKSFEDSSPNDFCNGCAKRMPIYEIF